MTDKCINVNVHISIYIYIYIYILMQIFFGVAMLFTHDSLLKKKNISKDLTSSMC